MGFKGGGVNVVSLAERRARRQQANRDKRVERMQERKAASDLGYNERRNVSRDIPVAWAGMSPLLLAEFQVDDDFDGAA